MIKYEAAIDNITGDIVGILRGGGECTITPSMEYTVITIKDHEYKELKKDRESIKYDKTTKKFIKKEV